MNNKKGTDYYLQTMKRYNEIQTLVDRYLAAETSPEEERRLALALHNLAADSTEPLPDDWQAVATILGELTLGEALYDEAIARRSAQSSASPLTPVSQQRAESRKFPLWRWAVAAVIVLTAGLGVVLYQSHSFLRPEENPSSTSGTLLSHQRDSIVPPVEHADPAGCITESNRLNQSTQPLASASTAGQKKKVRGKARPVPQGEAAEPAVASVGSSIDEQADIELLGNQQPSLGFKEQDLDLLAQDVRNIRQRGERLQRAIDAMTIKTSVLENN